MDAYLQETRLCDYSHPVIQGMLHRAIDNLEGEVEIARGIYYCVRDGIKYAVGGSGLGTKASRTVQIGYGDCGTKTNVHIALLRAAGIPARMRASRADASVIKDFLPAAMYRLFERAGKDDFHFWPECYISERWTACDALMDNKAYEGGLRKGLFTQDRLSSFEWDGEHDLVPLAPWCTEDLGHKPSWDDWCVVYKKTLVPTPRIVDRLVELCIAPSLRRISDDIREFASQET